MDGNFGYIKDRNNGVSSKAKYYKDSSLNRYILEHKLGSEYQHGPLEYYKAFDTFTGENVMLKLTEPGDCDFNNKALRLKREIEKLKILQSQDITKSSPYLLKALDYTELPRKNTEIVEVFIAYELPQTGTLSKFISNEFLKYDQRMLILENVIKGLKQIHNCKIREKGEHIFSICHRDIKPESIYLDLHLARVGGISSIISKNSAKIGNFTYLKTEIEPDITYIENRSTIGSIEYGAPQVYKDLKAHSRSSDIFSLGQLMYEVIEKKRLYDKLISENVFLNNFVESRSDISSLKESDIKQINDYILKKKDIEPEIIFELSNKDKDSTLKIQDIIYKCVNPHRDDAYKSMDEILEDFENIYATEELQHVIKQRKNIKDTRPLITSDTKGVSKEIAKKIGDTELSSKYDFIGIIGEGGEGVTVKAKHRFLKRMCALKILTDDSSYGRFKRSTQAYARVESPYIPKLYDCYYSRTTNKKNYLEMELIDGITLEKHIFDKKTQFDEEEISSLFFYLCAGLDSIHSQRILHRDIKPLNIMLQETEDKNYVTYKPYIVDIGFSKIIKNEDFSSSTELYVGTFPYIAPEQAEAYSKDKKCSYKITTDIYQLGLCMYETMLGSRHNNLGNPKMAAAYSITQEYNFEELEEIYSQKLVDICKKAIDKNPEERYQSAEKFSKDLQNFFLSIYDDD